MNELNQFTSLDDYKEYLDTVAETNKKVGDASAMLLRSDKYIEAVMGDDSLTEQEFVEVIALCRQVSYNRAAGGANKAAENETDRLYAKNPWKFVEEFLQNADDCDYVAIPEISIIIDEREKDHCSIEFCYNEKGFTRNDIWAITAFSESTKINDIVKSQAEEGVFYKEKTGRKGKGFKSVFSLSAENVIVHIRSNGFSFKLDNAIGRIMPIWEDDSKRPDGKTHVVVELIRPEFSTKDIYPEFRRLFCIDNYEGIFANSPFLFMHRLRMVQVTQITTSGEDTFITEYREDKGKTEYKHPITPARDKEILAGIAKDGTYYMEQLQEGEITTLSGNDESFNIPLIRYTRMVEDEKCYRNYSVISPIIRADTEIMWEGGALFRTFPMSLHPIKMPLAIDAPFILNPDRSGIQYSPYKDEEGQQVAANIWNSEVSEKLFEKGGILEAFFMWLRTLDGIRVDCYMKREAIILFEDRNNFDGHGNTWITKYDISDLCHNYPVFRLFANNEEYVSYSDARIVTKELFSWPHVDRFFQCMLGKMYEKCILSDMYVGSNLFRAKPIVQEGFSEALNTYLDEIENSVGLESETFKVFLNKQLYPYLRANAALITKTEEDAFKKMRIYLSCVKTKDTVSTVREAQEDGIKWFHSDNGEPLLSINRYRIYESSPVNISLLSFETDKILGKKTLYYYFGEKNQGSIAKRTCKTWQDAKDYIEAVCYFGFSTDQLRIPCLGKYVFSKKLDTHFNAFRETRVLKEIEDEDIQTLSVFFGNNIEATCEALQRMGVRKGSDYFLSEGTYLSFTEETLDVLMSDSCPADVLPDIRRIKEQNNKTISVTFDAIKDCQENVLLYFLDESNGLFSTDSYAGICDQIQKCSKYWSRSDSIAAELLIRAMAGASESLKNKEHKTLRIRIKDVLTRRLEDCVITLGRKNALKKLEIINDGFFEAIPAEEINPRLSLLKYDTGKHYTIYYKGDLSQFGGKKIFLRDVKGGNVYLNCGKNGDYTAALEKIVDKRFDMEALKYIDEMEQQYQDVRETVIVPFFNRTGHDLSRTYDEIERRFGQYDNKQIISILSWFRSQGYTNALGNGNINNEKEIEDDYRDDPWKFVYEFIQNVDDCSFTDRTPKLALTVSSRENRIVFEYNEDGFTLDDVKALTKFGDSNKSCDLDDFTVKSGIFDREKTGRKGRGFKAVFALPGDGIIVHVLSNGFSFKFVKRLGSIIPIWEEPEYTIASGTRITVEGFSDNYVETLMPQIKSIFGMEDLAGFFSICPILYLRKLGKVEVISDNDSFSVDIKVQNSQYTIDDFTGDADIVAGIMKNGQMKKAVWETLMVSVKTDKTEQSFQAVRNSWMFTCEKKTRIASVFAPIITIDSDLPFTQGALYRTLPLDEHALSIPLSINTCFDTNSGRSALEDSKRNNQLVRYVLKTLLPKFYGQLRKIPDIQIEKYIPSSRTPMFETYEKIESIDLASIIKNVPILRRYDGSGYVACKDAKTLPVACYKWNRPDILSDYFDDDKDVFLIDSIYADLHVAKREIDLISSSFAEHLNDYLDAVAPAADEKIGLMRDHIYPYLDKNYEAILRSCRQDDKQDTLNSMRIFVFEMADGSFARECADAGMIWMQGVPRECFSFGHFRSLDSSSLAGKYINNKWVNELHTVVDFEKAFTANNLDGSSVKSWDQAKKLIETILYYNVKRSVKIPYLSKCVLSEDYDPEKNYFRDGYIATGNGDIVNHLINREDLLQIAENSGLPDSYPLQKLADFMKELGLKKADDFFETNGRDIYTLGSDAIALLGSYCADRETAGEVLLAIEKSFLSIKSGKGGTLHLTYEDIERCAPPVFSRIFEYELISGELGHKLAETFCREYALQETDDYSEAYIRALFVVGKAPEKHNIVISLSQITDRCLGSCLQGCKVANPETLGLCISVDVEYINYPSNEIDKALRWLDDENAVSVSYEYYQTDLRKAFGETGESADWFLFDDNKVLLHKGDAENCMLKFVQKRYKGKDASFSSLISIIKEQNDLKKPWTGSKREYIEKLKRFRNDTLNKQKVLFPDYDKHLNDATGKAADYVIPELLQNINDCKSGADQETRDLEVSVDSSAGTMLIRYDEAGFDYANVYSITAIGQSSKHDESEGEKGLGFKKVFSLFEKVEIYSNGFFFSLSADKSTVPEWIGSKDRQDRYYVQGKTTMLFYTSGSNKKKLEDILVQWEKLVHGEYVGNNMSPLFLKNIDSIFLDGNKERFLRRELEKEFIFLSTPLLPFYEKLMSDYEVADAVERIEGIREKLRTRRKCSLMGPEEQDDYIEGLTVELCIPRKITDKNVGKGCFYSTLPTENPLYSTVFINVPLELTTGRDGIIEDSEYNKAIFTLLFAAEENFPGVLNKLIDTMADANRGLFMLNYLMPDAGKFIEMVSDLTGKEQASVKKGLEQLHIFKTFARNDLVSLEFSYSVDRIIYQYLGSVDNPVNDIETWMQENSENVEDLDLLYLSTAGECEKVENFAKLVDTASGYFPIEKDDRDLMLEYMSDEYGYVNGGDDDE